VALQHLARDLSIAWLIGTNQPDDLQAGEEEKSAERNKC
jgi:hypothetical protein